MGGRTRTSGGDDPEDLTAAWMAELTAGVVDLRQAAVDLRAGQTAVEKSIDGLAKELHEEMKNSRAAASALESMAKLERERLDLDKEDRKTRDRRDQEERKTREDWKKRIWESQAFQTLLTGVVLGLLQLAGFGWLANTLPELIRHEQEQASPASK